MFKIAKLTVPISSLLKLNSDVHNLILGKLTTFIHSKEIMNSFIEHLSFKVCIFGIAFSRILMNLFPHLNIY